MMFPSALSRTSMRAIDPEQSSAMYSPATVEVDLDVDHPTLCRGQVADSVALVAEHLHMPRTTACQDGCMHV